MNNSIILIFIIIALTIILSLIMFGSYLKEGYTNTNNEYGNIKEIYGVGYNDEPIYYVTHTNFPFWNMQLGTTRNMSYDIRGDIPIKRTLTGPWLNPETRPIYNKPLEIGFAPR